MIVGDVGVLIQVTVVGEDGVTPQDVSGATTKEILLVSPNGVILTKTASFVTNGTDGKLKYVTVANDVTVAGGWTARAHVVTATYDRKTKTVPFTVYA